MDLYDRVRHSYLRLGFIKSGKLVVPSPLEHDEKNYRVSAMLEEISEYMAARTRDEELDALIDLVVFALGTAVRHGFNRWDEAFERVMEANDKKIPGKSGKRGGWEMDLIKPDGWEPPDLREFVETVLDRDLREAPMRAVQRDFGSEVPDLSDVERDLESLPHARGPGGLGWLRSNWSQAEHDREHAKAVREAEIAEARRFSSGNTLDQELALVREERRAQDEEVAREVEVVAGRHRVPAIERLDQVHPQLLVAAALLIQKGKDYGDVDHTKSQYHPFGDASYLQMLHNKLERSKTLAGWGPDGFVRDSPNFDSQRDTVIDLINYAAFYAEWLAQKEAAIAEPETTEEP